MTAPPILDVAGAWTAHWSNLNAAGLSCLASDVHLVLHQIGARFAGSYDSGTLACNGTPFAGTVSGMVVNGLLNGRDVTFDMDSPNLHQGGAISGTSMSGAASWLVPVNGQAVMLTGTWTAAR